MIWECLRAIRIRRSDRISAPLTYGILKPVILMPKETDWKNRQQLQYVFLHEYMHICRLDIVWKLIAALALCIHWFNPLVWIMYILFNRDIELSCDESVVRRFGETYKSAYARALVVSAVILVAVVVLFATSAKEESQAYADNDGTAEEGMVVKGTEAAVTTAAVTTVKREGTAKVEVIKAPDVVEEAGLSHIATLAANDCLPGDVSRLEQYLIENYPSHIDMYEDPDNGVNVEIKGIKGLEQIDELDANERYNLWLEFRIPNEDSLTYQNVVFVSENGSWKIASYGLEK